MSWRDRPMCGLDTETTGVDIETARIVTACVGLALPRGVDVDGRTGWSPRNWIFTQDAEIPAEAEAIHGISTGWANQYGTDPAANMVEIRDDLYRAWAAKMPVVGFNVAFDLSLIDRELRRHGMGELEIRGPVLDPYVIDKQASRRRGSRKLADVCAHYGVTLAAEDAHGAEADARAACRLVWMMCGRADVKIDGKLHRLGGIDLERLHQLQVGWKREQAESYAAYRARQGDPLDRVDREWPIRPFPESSEVAA